MILKGLGEGMKLISRGFAIRLALMIIAKFTQGLRILGRFFLHLDTETKMKEGLVVKSTSSTELELSALEKQGLYIRSKFTEK